MKAKLSKYRALGDAWFNVDDTVVCELDGATVEVRQSTDCKCMVISIRDGKVTIESRRSTIRLVVRGTQSR